MSHYFKGKILFETPCFCHLFQGIFQRLIYYSYFLVHLKFYQYRDCSAIMCIYAAFILHNAVFMETLAYRNLLLTLYRSLVTTEPYKGHSSKISQSQLTLWFAKQKLTVILIG